MRGYIPEKFLTTVHSSLVHYTNWYYDAEVTYSHKKYKKIAIVHRASRINSTIQRTVDEFIHNYSFYPMYLLLSISSSFHFCFFTVYNLSLITSSPTAWLALPAPIELNARPAEGILQTQRNPPHGPAPQDVSQCMEHAGFAQNCLRNWHLSSNQLHCI